MSNSTINNWSPVNPLYTKTGEHQTIKNVKSQGFLFREKMDFIGCSSRKLITLSKRLTDTDAGTPAGAPSRAPDGWRVHSYRAADPSDRNAISMT
jgi:hypothetical protein